MVKSAWPINRHFIWLLILVVVPACNLLSSAPEQNIDQNAISGVPVVRLASPTANATYLDAVEVNIQAAISNAGADIDRVEIVVDGAVIATYPQPNPSGAPAFSITQSWPITAVGAHTIGATAYRSDGTASAPVEVTITIMGETEQSPADQPTDTPTEMGADSQDQAIPTLAVDAVEDVPTEEPTAIPEPTEKPKPTDEPEEEDDDPTVRILKGLNVRSGPGTTFNPPIGSMAANDETKLLAVNPAGDWYKIQYWNGEGWVYSQLVSVSGDLSGLPVDAGPPTPAPTAVPPTAAPQPTAVPDSGSDNQPVDAGNVNYKITDIKLDPNPLVCNKTGTIKITVKNDGDNDAPAGGVIRVKDLVTRTGDEVQRVLGVYPALGKGDTYVVEVYLTVGGYYDEKHEIKARVDYEDAIAETNEGDNQESTTYELEKGDC
jgi:uncharacterized protein YraI